MQKGFVESFNRRLCDEGLNEHLFVSYRHVSDVDAYGTNRGFCVREDFKLIVVTEGKGDIR